MATRSEDELQEELERIKLERDKYKELSFEYHGMLMDYRVSALEKRADKTETRLEPLEAGQIKANTIYGLIAGNGLLSIIALFKLFIIP